MLAKTYQQGFQLKKVFFLLFVCFCVTLWDFGSEADETHAYGKYWNKAMTLHKQKRHKEAERMFSVAISKYPNVAKFHLMRAKFRHHYMGKYHDAISGYSVVIKIAPKSYPEAYWWRGVCLDNFGLYERAIRD